MPLEKRVELGFILGLTAITLAVIALVIYFGRKLSRYVQTHSPDSDLMVHVTPSGNALFACLVGFWILCAISRELTPASNLGAFLSTTDGIAVVVIASIFFGVIAAAILEKLGYPIAERGGGGT